jgi:hypothetical protein
MIHSENGKRRHSRRRERRLCAMAKHKKSRLINDVLSAVFQIKVKPPKQKQKPKSKRHK